MRSKQHFTLVCSFTMLILLGCTLPTYGARPFCYELLPSRTLAYLRIADVRELSDKFDQTSLGKITQQQEMQSLTSRLLDEAEAIFSPTADAIGLTIRQLLAIPQGEIAIAAVAPPNGAEVTAPVLMVDVTGQQASLKKLMDLLDRSMQDIGREKETQVERGVSLTIYPDDDPRWTGIIHFQKDDLQVFTSNLDVATQILAAWDGDQKQQTLEDNQDFADVMRHSKGPKDEVPQIRWFIDPISLAKVSLRGNTAAQAGLGMLPVVGLDGLLALGGSYTMATDEFDTFVQAHVITAEPRTGILAMLAMERGDPTPENWVPHDAASYQTMYWNLERTEEELSQLYNSFRGADKFEEDVLARATEFLGVQLMEEIIGAMDGRLSLATWIPPAASVRGMTYLGGFKLKADHQFKKTLETMMENVGEDLEKKTFGGFTYFTAPAPEQVEEAEFRNPFVPGQGQLTIGVVGDFLLLANSADALERAIVTRSSKKSLANELDFKLVASKLRRQPGGKQPGRLVFERPEEGFRMLYEFATAQSTRDMLAGGAESNDMLRRLNDTLEENPLPPFAQLRKYLAPTGAIMTADEKGFHYIGFGLRRKSTR